MKIIAYIDIGFRENKRHTILLKYDGIEEVKRVKNLSDFLDIYVNEVYIDALTFKVIPELKTLVKNSIKVFYLSNLKLKSVRYRNDMNKSDESDAKIIPLREFKGYRRFNDGI